MKRSLFYINTKKRSLFGTLGAIGKAKLSPDRTIAIKRQVLYDTDSGKTCPQLTEGSDRNFCPKNHQKNRERRKSVLPNLSLVRAISNYARKQLTRYLRSYLLPLGTAPATFPNSTRWYPSSRDRWLPTTSSPCGGTNWDSYSSNAPASVRL